MESFVFINKFKHFEIEDKGKKRFFIKGDFSNTEKDLVNDICTPNCIKSMVDQLKSRSIKLDFEHETLRGASNLEKETNKTRLPVGKAIDSEVKDGDIAEATWELNEDYKKFDSKGDVVMNIKDIKSNIKSEMLDAFSIGYIPKKFHNEMKDGEKVRMLDELDIITVALTGSPINTTSQIRKIFVKSMTALEEFEKELKANPDLENEIEVKAESKRDNTRRNQARRDVLAEEDDDEEEEEETKRYGSGGKPKKKEKKTYEKDGAHAHTEDEPLGLHNHPEIEERVRFNDDMLNNRINFLADRLFEFLEDNSESEVLAIKAKLKSFSSPKGYSDIIKKEEKTIENKDESAKPEGEAEEKPAEESDGAEESNSEPLAEVKDLMKKQAEKIEALEKEVKSLSEIKSKELKANNKVIQENVDTSGTSEVKAVGGLNEVQ